MITDPVLQWSFSIIFALVALYLLWRVAAERKHPVQAVGHGLHLAMAVVMVAMAWPWWDRLPWLPQLLLFSVATLWFLAMAVLRSRKTISGHDVVGHKARHQLVHALMMGSMVWMVAVMAPCETDHSHGHHHHESEMSQFASVVGIGVTILLFAAAILAIIDAVVQMRRSGPGHLGRVAEHGVMATMLTGMAAMCWLMYL